MLRRFVTAGLAVVMSAALLACSSQDQAALETAQPAAEQASVRVGMSGSYYPFTYVENGKLQGFEVDLWDELGKRLDRKIEYVTAPFSGLFGMLESRRIDTISNQITVTDARLKKYNFANPYVYDGAQITVNNKTNTINTLEDLKGKKVAVNLGSNFEELLRKHDVNGEIKITTYDTGIEQEVALGRADAFIMDRLSAAELVKKSGLPLKAAGKPFEVIQNAWPFLKNEQSDALRSEVNQKLAEIRQDGTLAKIAIKWFGSDISKKD